MSSIALENRLVLHGALTIANCETLHAELSAALRRSGDVVVETDADAEVDLTFLQLLAAAGRSAAALNKRVLLNSPPNGLLAAAMRSCGLRPDPLATEVSQIFPLIPRSQA